MVRDTRTVVVVGVVALLLGAGLVGVGVTLADAGPGIVNAQTTGGPTDSAAETITVSASGSAEASPDLAVVRVSIEARADDPAVASGRVAENVTSVREALSELGIGDDQVRTAGYNVYETRERPPVRGVDEGGEPETTYVARHTLRVEVEDVDRVGEVIDAAVDDGATGVHGVRFTLSEDTREQLRKQAIEAAVSDARIQAGTLAAATSLSIEGVHSVHTGSVDYPIRPVRVELASAGGDGGGTAIETGPVTVTATVTVVYEASG